jgi:hypothetical protein
MPSGAVMLSNCTIWSDRITGSAIVISSTLVFITSRAPLFGVSPSNVGWFDLVIGYRQPTSEGTELLSSLDGPFLHIGNLSIPVDSRSMEFCVRDSGFERCFDDRMGRIESLIVRGGRLGNYTLAAWVDGNGGAFAAPDGSIHFTVDMDDSFISAVEFVAFPSRDASTYIQESDCISPSWVDLKATHDWRASSLFQITLPCESDAYIPSFDGDDGSTNVDPSKTLGLSPFVSTAAHRKSELPQRTEKDHFAAKSSAFEPSYAECVSRDWSNSCPFPERTANDHNAPKSLGFDESYVGSILTGLRDSCQAPDQTGPLVRTYGNEHRAVKSSAFEKSHVESAWTALSKSWPLPEETGSIAKLLKSTDNNKILDSIVFAKSCAHFSQMGFRESFKSRNSRVSDESGGAHSATTDSSNRSSWLTSVGFGMSGSFGESQARESRKLALHLNCSHFDRDSVDLARSVGPFDESSHPSTTCAGTRSAKLGISLAAASLGLAFDLQAIPGTATDVASLLLTSVRFPTSPFAILVLSLIDASIAAAVDADADIGQSTGVKTVWIRLAAIFAVLMAVGAIVLVVLVIHRRRASLAPIDETETDGAISVDVESLRNDLGNFLSGENALSQDRVFWNPKLKNDLDESFKSKVARRPDLPEHDEPE